MPHIVLREHFVMNEFKNTSLLRLMACTALLPMLLAGCATRPTDPAQAAEFDRTNDPLEPMNRAIFDFNDTVYTNILFPVARGYNKLPQPARTGVHNVIANLGEPVVFMNKSLQANAS